MISIAKKSCSTKFRSYQTKMAEGDMSCEFCNKVYIRKGALMKHIAAKHNEERQNEVDGQLFERLNIPEDICEFPGPDD